jgi:hypothetical protein
MISMLSPALFAYTAAESPAGPEPIIIRSYIVYYLLLGKFLYG